MKICSYVHLQNSDVLPPPRFWLESCTKTQRVVIRCRQFKRQPKAQHQGSADRSHFSAAVCIDGNGHRYRTMYCSMGEISVLCFPHSVCIATKRGYFTDEAFEQYVDFLLDSSNDGIPNDGKWRILIVDGYGSHTMVPSVLQKLLNRNIICISMPSHTSHALQPLDVSCFRPTKYFWSWSLRHIYGISSINEVTKYEAPYYFEVALRNGCTVHTIKSGFSATGNKVLNSAHFCNMHEATPTFF